MKTVSAGPRKPLTPGQKKLYHIVKNYDLYLMLLPTVVFIIVFAYVPMYGVTLAFKKYMPFEGIIGSPWIGFSHFERFFSNYKFTEILGNTLLISLYSFIASFPAPILLAISLNHLRNNKLKRIVQTVSYAPNFISTTVMVGMLLIYLSPTNGIVNQFLGLFGVDPINFMGEASLFKHIYVISGIWQGTGFGSIIYLAALSGVDTNLYEAATIDGANTLRKIVSIDLPTIQPVIGILLIMSIGGIMNVGFEKIYLMQNDLNVAASEVISTYTYKVGLIDNRMDYSTAIGLFNSVINCILLLVANTIARKAGETSLW